MNGTTEAIDACCEEILKRGMYSNKTNLLRLMRYVFRYTALEGKDVLEIGGSSGFMSLYASACGARRVVNVEPEAGLKDRFEEIVKALGYRDVCFDTGTLQTFDPGEGAFDVILSYNSINHVDEEACPRLPGDQEARQRYLNMFGKLTGAARSNAHFIIADCSNRNFFHSLGVTNPMAPTINWVCHQQPETWAELLQTLGRTEPRIRWSTLNTLGTLGRVLMGNRLVSYLTLSHFCLVMRKES